VFGTWKQIPVAGSTDGTRISVAQLGCSTGYNSSCDPGGNGSIDYADGAGYASSAGNSDTVDGYHATNILNAVFHDASWAMVDDYIALPTGLVWYGVFTPRATQAAITEVWCWSDDPNSIVQLRRSDGNDMVTGNLACGTTASSKDSSYLNSYAVIPVGYTVGMWQVSGAAKQIRMGIKYTTAY
jgi:hypothetical protein